MGGGVVRLQRPVASLAVITKLVELGHLQPGARHRATAVERAIDRLRSDLVRHGVVYDGNLSSSPKDERASLASCRACGHALPRGASAFAEKK
jgi:hypothetical protein